MAPRLKVRPGRSRRGEAPGCSAARRDRKSTRLNSSHANISYAVFCLKKKKHLRHHPADQRAAAKRTSAKQGCLRKDPTAQATGLRAETQPAGEHGPNIAKSGREASTA